MCVCVCSLFFTDMGQGQRDDTQQPKTGQFPSLNTTRLVQGEASKANLILHIGDISYARGYAGVVSLGIFLYAIVILKIY